MSGLLSKHLFRCQYDTTSLGSEKGLQRALVEAAAQAVLDARRQFPEATLADLYDPLAMPPVLVKAHAALYEKLTAPLLPAARKTRPTKRSGWTSTENLSLLPEPAAGRPHSNRRSHSMEP